MTPGAPSPVSPASCNGAGAGTLVSTYYIGADPVGSGGIRFFGMNQGGTIYWSTAVIPVTQFGAPAGAQPFSKLSRPARNVPRRARDEGR